MLFHPSSRRRLRAGRRDIPDNHETAHPLQRAAAGSTGCATTGDLEETRRQLDQVNRQASTRLNEVESKLSNEKLLEMVSQLEAMKAEVAKLRGDVEVLNYNLQTTQKRQNDLYNDLDGRLGHLENSGAKPAAAPHGDAWSLRTAARPPARITTRR